MASSYFESLFYPSELLALIRYRFFRPIIATDKPTWSKTKQRCYYFLEMTSGSFASIIMDLQPELRDLDVGSLFRGFQREENSPFNIIPLRFLEVCVFYLCLRGMDTIEDDMTLPIEKKEPLLRSFHEKIIQQGWTFKENGLNEKDRQLLEEFNVVIEEFFLLPKKCQEIILDITKKMGNGMADFTTLAARNKYSIVSIKDLDLYCYYVAGLVGIGLSDLFNAVGSNIPDSIENSEIIISMGVFLQKLNILRDFIEDLGENRKFWPKEIWSRYVDEIEDLILPENSVVALYCLNAMVLNTLTHVPDAINYLTKLENINIFGFSATPLVMGYATLALVFKNYDAYSRVVKIRKGEAAKLVFRCTDISEVSMVFLEYTQVIRSKNIDSQDPSFEGINKICDQSQLESTRIRVHSGMSVRRKLWLPARTDRADLHTSSSGGFFRNTMSNSWFSVQMLNGKLSEDLLSIITIEDAARSALIPRSRKRSIDGHIYNPRLDMIREGRRTKKYLRKRVINNDNYQLENAWVKETPSGVRDCALSKLSKAYDTNLKSNKKFTIKKKSNKYKPQSIAIEKKMDFIRKNMNVRSLSISKTSEIKNIVDITRGRLGRFYICVCILLDENYISSTQDRKRQYWWCKSLQGSQRNPQHPSETSKPR
ncbi:16051_t:CDS:10 [Acaulospora morrowiae]|uniref:squalene synthase n=1 Tax=Acaulospora morrowiae TaxID=94023 RepID=A0A9N9DMD8_9GLOM|nr:16051_t:CDS:10 [Acaulospora morrowiae]